MDRSSGTTGMTSGRRPGCVTISDRTDVGREVSHPIFFYFSDTRANRVPARHGYFISPANVFVLAITATRSILKSSAAEPFFFQNLHEPCRTFFRKSDNFTNYFPESSLTFTNFFAKVR
jgi:hypothetical protein